MKKHFLIIITIAMFIFGCTPPLIDSGSSNLSSISLTNLPDRVSAEHSYIEMVSEALRYKERFFIKDILSNDGIKFEPGVYTLSTVLYDSEERLVGKNIESNDLCKSQIVSLTAGSNSIRLVVCTADDMPIVNEKSDVGITGIDVVDPGLEFESLEVFLKKLVKELLEFDSIIKFESHIDGRQVALNDIKLTDNARDFGYVKHLVTVRVDDKDWDFWINFTAKASESSRLYKFNSDTKLKVTGQVFSFDRSFNTYTINFSNSIIEQD